MNVRMITLVLLTAMLAAAGCQRTQLASPLNADYEPTDAAADVAFWEGLADRPLTTNNEAFHGLVMFIQDKDAHKTYENRVKFLKEGGYLSSGFSGQKDEAVERGTVARILCKALDIRGGVTMTLLGPSARYGARELVYMNIMPPSTEQQGMSGIEFAGIIAKAQEYKEVEK